MSSVPHVVPTTCDHTEKRTPEVTGGKCRCNPQWRSCAGGMTTPIETAAVLTMVEVIPDEFTGATSSSPPKTKAKFTACWGGAG